MRLLITGVGDAFSSRHFGSSAVIDGPEGLVLIDCPDLVHRALREASTVSGWHVDAEGIDDIIITHLHGDHCNGLESFGFWRRLLREKGDRSVTPRLHTSRASADRLWERLAPAMDAPFAEGGPPSRLDDYFDVSVLPVGAASGRVAGLDVRCRFTLHPVPTTGLLISDGRVTLGWSSDTAFDPAHIEWLSAADLIIHEANVGGVHTPVEKLNALPDAVRAKMCLNHLLDDFDPSCTDIHALHEGEVVDVRPS